jgi:hypothetical protein
VRALAALDRQTEFHVFGTHRAAADSFRVTQDNVAFHVLWPGIR